MYVVLNQCMRVLLCMSNESLLVLAHVKRCVADGMGYWYACTCTYATVVLIRL